ncbi:unnamed protein product (macronuclear) [Paramecium tetraurelia]|uniref:Transmembrane protein n=1 Tax=Paramecium tetraurelia TaxID=5888 RepID=A0CEP1_PARTE|nr:uncharacterized protein GSPATT00037697001 [Paramecium tetraurelia]CAK69258.1 unnamed protein product [Paramecium tetraurelia]|eukprot:XP_001436655.1 hypothetical protein (macronuclear) [Paramecium tetraurelia strain d4-2]
MNRLTLRFKDPALEKQYEQSQFEMYRTKSNYYFLTIFLVICVLQFISEWLYCSLETGLAWKLINIVLIAFTLIFLCKYPQFGKEAIFFENLILISSKLQHLYSHMGHDDDKITDLITLTDLEYHLHILQVFDVGCFQIVLQSANNIFMEYFIGTRVNIFQIVNNILCASIKMIVMYFFKEWSRQQFTLFLKDQIWQQQLPNIIQKPFFKFTLENFTKQFRSILSNQIEMFPSYDPNFCEGCNLRSFLRFCIRDKKTLEQKLLDDYIHKEQIQGKNNEEVWYSNNLKHYSIRICNLNVERFKCLIILEEYKHKEKQSISNNLIKKQLLRSISSRSNHITNKFFKLGMYTIFSINNEQIGLVNMYILLKRLSTYYSFLDLKLLPIQGENYKSFLIKTYSKKIVSFMVCIFNIFIKIQTSKIKKIFLKIEILDWDTICIQTEGVDHKVFLEEYKMNLYLVQVEQQLLVFPVSDSLRFVFQSQKDKEPLEMKYLKNEY